MNEDMKKIIPLDIIAEILDEIVRARKIHPLWSDSPVRNAAIVCEESGELIRACNNYEYDRQSPDWDGYNEMIAIADMRTEAVQTAATAIRFLKALDRIEERRLHKRGGRDA